MTPIDLLLRNFDELVLAPEAAENPDPALRNAEMLCQQFDDCLVGFVFPGWFFYPDYEAIAFQANLFGLGIGLYLNLDFHPPSLPVFPGYEILPI